MSDHEVVRSLTELLILAKVAMPNDLFAVDPRIVRARQLVAKLAQASPALNAPPWDITAGLDAFMASGLAPESRTDATILILRDWLVGHGYIEPAPEPEETH